MIITKQTTVLRVKGKSITADLAGAITAIIKENKNVELHSIGAAAINTVMKAIAISKGHLAPCGITIMCSPSFTDVVIDGEEKTCIKTLVIEV